MCMFVLMVVFNIYGVVIVSVGVYVVISILNLIIMKLMLKVKFNLY